MLHRVVIIVIVSVTSLRSPCNAGVILQTASDVIHSVANVMGNMEKRLEPSALEVVATVGDLIHDTAEKYSLQNMQQVFNECLQDCWAHLLNEELIETCVSEQREKCDLLKGYSDKELIPYFSTLKAGSKFVRVPGDAMNAALGLKSTGDAEDSMSKRAVSAGVKLMETTAAEKITEEFFDTGKQKVLNFIESFRTATDTLGSGIYNGKSSIGDMVDSVKKLPETDEVEQIKSAIEDGKHVVKTALQSSKDVAKSVSSLPIQSATETGNYAINSILGSGYEIMKSDNAVQFRTAIGDSKSAVTSLVNSGIKLKETVKSIPQQIVNGAINCSTGDITNSSSLPIASEENEQIKKALSNGLNAVETLVSSGLKLSESLSTLPMKTAVDVGNFAVDSFIESGLKIAKSDEAKLLNAAVFAGKNTTASMVGSGKKFVDIALDVPLNTASDIKTIALETIVDTKRS